MTLREWRTKKGMTLTDMSLLAGISVSHLCMIELGQRNPSLTLARKITDVTRNKVKF